MKNILKNIKEKTWLHYLFIILVGLLISIPLLKIQIRGTDDGFIHLIRLIGLDASISKGDFPFLVFPHICRDFGYSMTALYPPIVTYIPYIFGLLSGAFAHGLKIFAIFTTILSGIFMYNFINQVTKNKLISLFSSLIYIVFPYRFEDIYNRFAIGEFTAFVFIPIVFQGLYNLIHEDGKKHFYIAIGAIGLMISHTISTVYTALFCIVYILFNAKKFFKKDIILKCLINVLFILLISAFFVIPMLEYRMAADYSIFIPDVMKTSGEYTQNRVIEPWQLLKDKGEENGVSFIVGVPAIFMLASTILVYKDIENKYKDFYILFCILGIFSLFMCFKYFPWYYMPNILNTIQYPWRMIGFALFFFTPVFAMNIYYLFNGLKSEKFRNIAYIFVIIILGIFTAMRLTIYKIPENKIDEFYENSLKENLKISHFSVNRDYLPYKALKEQSGYLNTRENRVYILNGKVNITSETKQDLYLEFEITNAEKGTILELPYIFYPGYTVILENGENKIKLETTESDKGFLCIEIPEDIEKGKITAEYTGTTIEKVSYAISGISLICFIVYIFYFKKGWRIK